MKSAHFPLFFRANIGRVLFLSGEDLKHLFFLLCESGRVQNSLCGLSEPPGCKVTPQTGIPFEHNSCITRMGIDRLSS